MNREASAGGIIISKYGNRWYVLLMKDMNGNWTFPKGKIEKDESHEEAAKREIHEEVGLSGLIKVAELTPSHYWYYRHGSIKKTVYYFLFKSEIMNEPVVQTEEGISEARWVTFSNAATLIGYPDTNGILLKEVHKKLTTLNKR